jgi:hypothetical protein
MSEQGSVYQLRSDVINSIDQPLHVLNSDRIWLARLFRQMGFTRGVEIGTGGGVYAEQLCICNPDLHLITIDLWKPYSGYIDYSDPDALEKDHQDAIKRLAPYNAEIIQKDSMDATNLFPDGSFDFCYIDANHLNPWIDNDIYWWSRKVRTGGIVSGHDYANNHKEVINAVEYFTDTNHIRPWYIVGKQDETGQADLIPSWFWAKGENELAR